MPTAKFEVVSNTIGHIIAFDLPEETYLRDYAQMYCEWVNGTVVKFPTIDSRHSALTRYLTLMLNAYFKLRPIGRTLRPPFVMRLAEHRACYEPDIQILLTRSEHRLNQHYVNGPADIAVEIISEESQRRDYGEKLHAYEQGRVAEYWMIDPLQKDARFYVLSERGAYRLQDETETYTTPRLPGLQVHVPTLWQDTLPGPVGTMVRAMLEDNDETAPSRPPEMDAAANKRQLD